jgi:tricarballylate dehydrogenase
VQTHGLPINKSNWARSISQPPFVAYQVTCGITLTYGGLAIDEAARVQNEEGEAIAGLYAAGELVGGLYFDRYPGGAGLTSGSVFGRIAGANAASC